MSVLQPAKTLHKLHTSLQQTGLLVSELL